MLHTDDIEGDPFAGLNGTGAPDPTAVTAARTSALRDLTLFQPGSAAADALVATWEGHPAVTIGAAPGAGKTQAVAAIAATLANAARLRIIIACNTRDQTILVANRIAQVSPGTSVTLVHSASQGDKRPPGLNPQVANSDKFLNPQPGQVIVTTAAKLAVSHADGRLSCADLLICDEAYQLTFAGFRQMAGYADQYLLVGDPGQLRPVVTADTSRWDGRDNDPTIPAPLFLANHHADTTLELRMDASRRLGPTTCEIVSALYPFPFASTRAPTRITDAAGRARSEIEVVELGGLASEIEPRLVDQVVNMVAGFVGGSITVDGDGWGAGTRRLKPADIAVIAPRNTQIGALRARLGGSDLTRGAIVATVDSAQGGEWPVVVAIDPFAGVAEPRVDFELATGRLCVSLSRHQGTLVFVSTTPAEQAIAYERANQPGSPAERYHPGRAAEAINHHTNVRALLAPFKQEP